MSDDWDNDRPDDGGFMGSEGNKYPALSFSSIGDTHEGTVIAVKAKQDADFDDGTPLTWPDGSPKHVYLFEIEQADGEMGTIWVRGNAVKAIREAVTTAGAKSPVGWHLKLQHHALGEKVGKRKPAKLFRAKVTPAVARARVPAAPQYEDEEPF